MTDIRNIKESPATTTSPSGSTAPQREPWEDALKHAFDGMHAPQDVCDAALAAIEDRLASQLDDEDGVAAKNAAPRKRWGRVLGRVLAAAACVLAVAAGVLGVRLQTTPAAYVGVDINPSLELSVNAFGTVLAAQPLNDDGQVVLQGVSLEGESFEDALAALLASEGITAYAENNPYIEISVTADDEALAARLQGASEDCLRQSGCEGSCHRADAEAREDAHHAGMGVGKYRAAQQLMELDDSVTLDDCAGMTMRELHDRIDACADGAESGRGEHGAHSGAGQGAGKEAGGTNAGAGSHGHHGSDE